MPDYRSTAASDQGLEGGAADRPTGHIGEMAQPGLPSVLAAQVQSDNPPAEDTGRSHCIDPEDGSGESAVGSQTDPGRVEEAGLLRQDTRQDDSPFFPYFAALPTVGLTGDARIMEELHKISLNSG